MEPPAPRRDQRNRFVAFSFAAADLLLEVNEDGSIACAHGECAPLLGLLAEELAGQLIFDFFSTAEHEFLRNVVEGATLGARFGPVLLPLASGLPTQSVVLSGCRMPDDPKRLYLALSETTYAMMPDRIAKHRDPMTSLLDRDGFIEVAKDTLATARELGQQLCFSLFELAVPPQMRTEGDEGLNRNLLVQMAATLRAHALNNAVGKIGHWRYGLLHEAGVDATQIGEKMKAAMARADPQGAAIGFTHRSLDFNADLLDEDVAAAIAFTVRQFVDGGETAGMPQSLLEASQAALSETSQKLKRLRKIIAERRMKLVAQPIIAFSTGKPHHHELLVRFDSERSPFEMITFAEQMDVIQDLDLTICEMALEYVHRTSLERPLKLAVNLSGRSIATPSFVARLLNLLINRGLGRQLMFEITESAHIEDLESVNAVINGLRRLGHLICLDDFGAGSASFPYLASLDVDFVKIDGRYVREASASRRSALMLKSIAGLCRDLGIKTVAEMVETQEQAKLMEKLGLDFAQGYFFGRPQPMTDFVGNGMRPFARRSQAG